MQSASWGSPARRRKGIILQYAVLALAAVAAAAVGAATVGHLL